MDQVFKIKKKTGELYRSTQTKSKLPLQKAQIGF